MILGPPQRRVVSGVVLAWQEAGSGLPLLLLHGGSGRRQWFGPMVEQLSPEVAAFALDLPGHGESENTPGRYQVAQLADVATEFVETVIGAPAVVFGHSHGGHVALLMAGRHPDHVQALIVGDSPLSLAVQRAVIDRNRRMTSAWRDLAASGRSPQELAVALEDVTTTPAGTSEAVPLRDLLGPGHLWFAEMGASLAAHDPDFLDAVLERFDDTYEGLDATELLPQIGCPVLLLQADPAAGGLLDDDDTDLARRLLAHAEVIRIEGVGHGLQLQAPTAVARAVTPFLQALSDGPISAVWTAAGAWRQERGSKPDQD